jgi:hypothetical protein
MWVCDSCGEKIEHEDINPPPGWAQVRAFVTWRNDEDAGNSEWTSAGVTLCNKGCRTGSGDALEARSLKILREGFASDAGAKA